MRYLQVFLIVLTTTLWSCKCDYCRSLTVSEFEDLITDPNIQILDVRTKEEFAEGHIQSATNIDCNHDNFGEIAQLSLDKTRPVAIYCRRGTRSKRASCILCKKGFRVYELQKGLTAWIARGKPVVK